MQLAVRWSVSVVVANVNGRWLSGWCRGVLALHPCASQKFIIALQTSRPLELNPPCRHELPTTTAPANCSAGYTLSMSAMLAEACESAAAVTAGILVDFIV